MKRYMIVLFITFGFAVSGFAQYWDYVMSGDAVPSKFGRYEGFDNWAEWSFVDSSGARMDFVFKVATDPDDSTNNVLQCVDLYNLGENVKMAIMTGDRLPEGVDYDKATYLFRARCIRPSEVPDTLEIDTDLSRRFLGWNIKISGQDLQIQFETGEDSDDPYPNWIRAARAWSDSARTRNDTLDKFAWHTYRFTVEVSHADSGLFVKGYLDEDPDPIIDVLFKEWFNPNATTGTAFFFGDDRTSGWKINDKGVMNGGAKAWFDWVAVSYGHILPPGTPLPLNCKVDGPDGNPVKNEGWVWLFDGSKNLLEGATNTYTRLAISNDMPGWETGQTYHNSFMYYYDNPDVVEVLYNSMCANIEDPDNPGNMLLELVDDNEAEDISFVIGPYVKGELFAPRKGTVIWRTRNLTEDEGPRCRRGWAATATVPGFDFGDIKAETGYYGDQGLPPCTVEFFHQSTNIFGRRPYTVDESGNFVPNAWLASIGGTFNAFEWHTYRMTWDRDLPDSVSCKLYIDENPIPALENQPWPKDPPPEVFGFLFGDQRTSNKKYDDSGASNGKTAQSWDYIAVNFGNAYAPGEGEIPEGLIVDINTKVDKREATIVESFNLSQNYPNPFNPATTIQFATDKNTNVELTVYDLLGKKVKTLVDSKLSSGVHSVIWDGTNGSGVKVGSGVYYYTIKTNDGNTLTRKMVLMK